MPGVKREASGTPTMNGLLRRYLIISIVPAAPSRTGFLFLEETPFADCHEGNTQEELLAVTCFSKH